MGYAGQYSHLASNLRRRACILRLNNVSVTFAANTVKAQLRSRNSMLLVHHAPRLRPRCWHHSLKDFGLWDNVNIPSKNRFAITIAI